LKILHSSDWHLGQNLRGYDRAYEHHCFLAWLLLKIQTGEIDLEQLPIPPQPAPLADVLQALADWPFPDVAIPAEQHPFVEVRIRFDAPEPDARTAIENALKDKPVRFAGIDANYRRGDSSQSVGPPVEMLIYHKDSFCFDEYYCFDSDDDYMLQLRRCWESKLSEAIAALPSLGKTPIKTMRVDL